MENQLIFQTSPTVILGSNIFIDVPVILKYEDTELICVVKQEGLGFTTQIPIYHQDGTYLAKVTGNRIYATPDGEKAGLKVEKYEGLWVCSMDNKTLFEIQQQTGDAFKTTAELYTPDGYFVKYSSLPTPNLIDKKGNELKIGGLIMSECTISGCAIGVLLKKDGSFSLGVNS